MKRKAKRIVPNQHIVMKIRGEDHPNSHDGMGTTMPPTREVLRIYFDQKGEADMVDDFYNEHDARRWKTQTGGTIFNWKVCAAEWIYNYRQEAKRRLRQSPFFS